MVIDLDRFSFNCYVVTKRFISVDDNFYLLQYSVCLEKLLKDRDKFSMAF